MLVAQAEDKGVRLSIHSEDETALDPRKEFDNLATMVCWNRHYDLGDKHSFDTPQDFQEWIKENKSLVLPLYMYDHSGIGISTDNSRYPYNCPWDSGQLGYVYITHKKIKEEYSVKKITRKVLDRAGEVILAEVEQYNQYLSGDVYGYTIEEIDKCKECNRELENHVDSCWGFYGNNWDDNGMRDNVALEHRHLFDKLESKC